MSWKSEGFKKFADKSTNMTQFEIKPSKICLG